MIDDLATTGADAQWLLQDAEPGDWSRAALTSLAASRGWLAVEVPDGSGLDPVEAGQDGRRVCGLVAFGDWADRYGHGRECRELSVPVLIGEQAEPRQAAAAFHAVRDVLVETLGPADAFGDHGGVGPWLSRVPGWGAPFLRWRRPGSRALELRATRCGVDLVLQLVGPYEAWRADMHEWSEPGTMTGFVAERTGPNNEGLFTPGVQRVSTWKQWQALIPSYLRVLPAVTAALGERLTVQVVVGNSPRLWLVSTVEGELFLRAGLRAPEDPALQGWHRTTERAMAWRYDAGGPGQVDGAKLAQMLVTTLKVEKAKTVSSLRLIAGSETHWRHYGLLLG